MTTIMPAALRTETPAANPRRDVRHDERRDGAEAAPFAATLAAQDRRPAGDSRSTVNSSGGRSRTDASARRNPDAGARRGRPPSGP
ncbi:MAG: hypothetical protein IPI34_03640 [bacterium]|nr:hypothetical protein [bacterium]